jgi:RimJ/RimL family protein N-acetyltransferase
MSDVESARVDSVGQPMPIPDTAAPRGPAVATRFLALLRRMGFDYSCFKVFSLALDGVAIENCEALPDGYRFAELSVSDLRASPFPELRDCDEYGGGGSSIFGIFRDDGVLVCVQCIWFGQRNRRPLFWPIEDQAAVSMHLVTVAAEQSKGLGTKLKRYSAEQMRQMRFARLYSRIWWTNVASVRVSEKAGWSHVGTVLELFVPGFRRPLRIAVRRFRKGD